MKSINLLLEAKLIGLLIPGDHCKRSQPNGKWKCGQFITAVDIDVSRCNIVRHVVLIRVTHAKSRLRWKVHSTTLDPSKWRRNFDFVVIINSRRRQ